MSYLGFRCIGIIALVFSPIGLLSSEAQIPLQINHQGVVKVNGVPFNGTGLFRFAIVDPDQNINGWTNDGSMQFVEGTPNTSVSLQVASGLYSVLLGDPSAGMIPIPEFLFNEPNRVLRVWFDDGTNGLMQLVPDHPLTTAPYSFNALRAEMAGIAEFATSSETSNRASVADMADVADRALTADFAENASRAMEADYAGDADTLDGLDSTDFLSQAVENVQMFNEEFVVAPGETIEAGNAVSFVDGSPMIRKGYATAGPGPRTALPANEFLSEIEALSETRTLAGFIDLDDSSRGFVSLGEVAGDVILFGSPETFAPDSVGQLSIAALSESKFVLLYLRSQEGIVRIGEVSGDSINFGNGVLFNPAPTFTTALATLSADRFVVAYEDGGASSAGTARVGDVSGVLISLGPEVPFHPAITSRIRLAKLSSERMLFAIKDESSGDGLTYVADIAGNIPTFGTGATFTFNSVSQLDCAPLSRNRFVLAYSAASSGRVVRIGEASGEFTLISEEFRYRSSGTGSPLPVASLSPHSFVLSETFPAPVFGNWVVGEIFGNRIDRLSEGFFSPTLTETGSLAVLTPNRFAVAYHDESTIPSFSAVNIVRPRDAPILGIARESGAAGESVSVTLFTRGALSDSHTGLVPGEMYFGHPDGSVSTDDSGVHLGVAVSQTKVLLLAL